jgi:hypothetical protein
MVLILLLACTGDKLGMAVAPPFEIAVAWGNAVCAINQRFAF